jgi:OOP family OmpA-OmpF porin
MRHRAAIVTVAAGFAASLLLAAPAGAADRYAPPTGAYLSLSGFLVGLTDSDFRDSSVSSVEGDLESGTGWGAALALGTYVAGFLRLEGEVSYRQNENDKVDFGVLGDIDLDGNRQAIGLMANLVFEPAIGQFPLRPYIGAGLGGANIALEARDLDIDDDDWVFAFQGLAGLALDLGRAATLVGGYRYFAADDASVGSARVDYRAHNLEVGVRFRF